MQTGFQRFSKRRQTKLDHRSYAKVAWIILPPLLALGLLSRFPIGEIMGYTPIHTILETFSIVVALMIFGVGWNGRRRDGSQNVLLLATAFLGVGLLDLLHALSWPGMPPFITENTPNKSISFWLSARLLESLALIAAILMPASGVASRKARTTFFAGVLSYVYLVSWLVLFREEWLPASFIPGTGLTPFKIATEYAILTLHLLAVAILGFYWRNRLPFHAFNLLSASLLIIISELCFTLYRSTNDAYNFLGHVLKVAAYVFIYRGIFIRLIQEPFRRLRVSESHLRASEQKFRGIVENMPVMMTALDDQGLICTWNRECERVTGFSAAQVIGNPKAYEWMFPEREYQRRLFREISRREGEFRSWVWDLRCSDGKTKSIEWSSVSRRVPIAGWATWVIGVDVTERRQLEEQLRQSQKMEAVGQLAGSVAHDFNNLLTVIRTYSETILEQINENKTGPALARQAEQILKTCDRSTKLIRQLLTFSRRQIVKMAPVDLNHVITEFRSMLLRFLDNQVEFSAELQPNLKSVLADPVQIEQVIMNLVVNARDAMPEGGRLSIETRATQVNPDFALKHGITPGGYAVLTVRDTGHGMDRETVTRIFEPFFTTKEKGKGTGLGLSTVYGIIRQCNGTIAVESIPDMGTSFHIYLPYAMTQASTDSVTITTASGTQLSPPSAGSATILVVEDETDIRSIVVDSLQRAGFRVLDAENGADALEVSRAEKGPIHLLITDIMMPKMDGKQLAAQIRLDRPELKILFASGYVDDAILQAAKKEKLTSFLEKPFTLNALFSKVHFLLGTFPQSHSVSLSTQPTESRE